MSILPPATSPDPPPPSALPPSPNLGQGWGVGGGAPAERWALTPLQEVGHILVLGQVGGAQLLVDAQEKVEQGLQPQEAGVQHQLLELPQPHLG